MKNNIIYITVFFVALALIGLYAFYPSSKNPNPLTGSTTGSTTDQTNNDVMNGTSTVGTSDNSNQEGSKIVIGKSVEGRNITAYNYGSGDTRVLFVGGVHGGYSWNTALLAYQVMDYLNKNPNTIPANVTVTVIPVLNPDGLNKAVGTDGIFTQSDVSTSDAVLVSSRLNSNKVDLSRNFDCDWQTKAVWQEKPVSGGSSVFSEPESLALKNYIESHKISSAVVWYSSAGGVYASSCGGSAVTPETSAITNLYANASGYKAYQDFKYYKTTGDIVDWLVKKNIPSISILLTNHTDTELDKNVKGVGAILQHFAK